MLHTRLRPHCKEFLEKIAKLYELHVFTFGSRLYAHTIAGKLYHRDDSYITQCFVKLLFRSVAEGQEIIKDRPKLAFPSVHQQCCIKRHWNW